MKEASRSPVRAVVLSAISEGSSALLLLFGLLVARATGPNGYGIFSYALAFAGLFAMFLDGGLSVFLARQGGRHPRRGRLAARSATALQISIFPMLAATFFAVFFAIAPDFVPLKVVALAGLATAARAIKNTLRGLFQSRNRFGAEALLMVTERLALVTLGTCALVLSMDVTRIMTWFCVIKVLDLTVSLVVANRIAGSLSPRFRLRWIRWVLLSILPFFATMALVMAYNYFDILMLGYFRDEADVGIYGAIYTFFAALVLVPSAFSNAYLPSMSKAHDKSSNELQKSAESALRLLFVMSAPVVVGTLAGASELLQIVFGSDYLRGAMGLRILMLSTPCVFLFWFLRSTLIAIGEIRKLLWVTAAGLSINIALNIFLIPDFGIAGACVATLAAEFVLLILASRLVAATNIKVVTYRTALAFLVTGICFACGMLAGHLVTTWWLAGIPAGVILAHFALCRIDFWSSEELAILRRFRLAW